MKLERVGIFFRLISLIIGTGGFTAAWYLKKISSAGIEDVPPPFILIAGITGFVFLCIAIIGKYPRPKREHQ